jgi:hypothetical protein
MLPPPAPPQNKRLLYVHISFEGIVFVLMRYARLDLYHYCDSTYKMRE